MIFLIILIMIFIRPFICALAFPYLNFIYSAGLLVFLAIYITRKKLSFSNLSFLSPPFILFILAICVSVVFSQNKLNSFRELYKYIIGPLLFFTAASLPREDKSSVIRVIVFTGLAVSLLAIYQYFLGFGHTLGYLAEKNINFSFALDYLSRKRAFLPFLTPAALGGYLAMAVPLFFINKNKIWLAFPVFLALFFTGSLGAFLSLFFALFIYFFRERKFNKSRIALLFGLLVLLIIVFIYRYALRVEHSQPFFSAVMRIGYWKDALGVIREHPLAGVGIGNFNLNVSRYAHNSYLQIWAEAGILGLTAFIWIVCVVFKFCFKNLPQSFRGRQTACLLVAGLVFLMHNFFDFTFFLPEIVFVWWVILGLLVL